MDDWSSAQFHTEGWNPHTVWPQQHLHLSTMRTLWKHVPTAWILQCHKKNLSFFALSFSPAVCVSLSLSAHCGTRSLLCLSKIASSMHLQPHTVRPQQRSHLSTMHTPWNPIPTAWILQCQDEALGKYVGGARRGSWKICLLSLKHTRTSQGFILVALRC